jgi:hypothetical protein
MPLVALGGAAEVLVPEVARALGRPLLRPDHPEVLSSIGAALALVRAEVVRTAADEGEALEIAREAELACVEAGAAPATVAVETAYEAEEGLLRAVATGAVALETGAAQRRKAGAEEQIAAASAALGLAPEDLSLLASTDFYRIFSENGSGRVAVVDQRGSVALAESTQRVFAGEGRTFVERLRVMLDESSLNLGVAQVLPRVSIVCGPRVLDLSDARRAETIIAAAERALAEHPGEAVALLAR